MKNLSEKSLLVNVKIAQWSARKLDKKVTSEVNQKHNTTDAGNFNKLLIERDYLKDIQAIATEARTFHYENTLPWSDQGDRLLPSENYFDYTSKMSELKDRFNTAVNKFVLSYPAIIEDAKKKLNGLFNQNDYPVNIGARFEIKTSFMPVPEVQDIRVNLSAGEVEKIKTAVQSEISERFQNAQRSIYERVIDQLNRMHERLTDKDAVFRDSLFNNVLVLVDLLPRLNVTCDQQITDMCEDLRRLYAEPENVRNDQSLRKQKAKEVEDMLGKINSFFKPQ